MTSPPAYSNGMTPSREQLEQWDREHVWHPFTPMQAYAAEQPLIIAAARGCFLVDLGGREYLYGVSSLWCNVHGHRVPQLDASLREQLDADATSTLMGISNVPVIRLARRPLELTPPGLNSVFYSDSVAPPRLWYGVSPTPTMQALPASGTWSSPPSLVPWPGPAGRPRWPGAV